MKLILQHHEENIKGFLRGWTNYDQFLPTSLKYAGRTAKHRLNIINTSFCAEIGLLLTKLNHYFNDSIDSNILFGQQRGIKI